MAVAAEPASSLGTLAVSCRIFGHEYAASIHRRHPDQTPAPCTALYILPLVQACCLLCCPAFRLASTLAATSPRQQTKMWELRQW
jgi:hypothetical protein